MSLGKKSVSVSQEKTGFKDMDSKRNGLIHTYRLEVHGFAKYIQFLVPGEWSDFGNWSLCSETCGFGVKERKRTCLDPRNLCNGSYYEIGYCFITECNITDREYNMNEISK